LSEFKSSAASDVIGAYRGVCERVFYDFSDCHDFAGALAPGHGDFLHHGWSDPCLAGRRDSRRAASRDTGTPGDMTHRVTAPTGFTKTTGELRKQVSHIGEIQMQSSKNYSKMFMILLMALLPGLFLAGCHGNLGWDMASSQGRQSPSSFHQAG
jgi:hypothetical protein